MGVKARLVDAVTDEIKGIINIFKRDVESFYDPDAVNQ